MNRILLRDILKDLKQQGKWAVLAEYFEEERKKKLEEAVYDYGNLTQERMLALNIELRIYHELQTLPEKLIKEVK